jgi:hypothetical protein
MKDLNSLNIISVVVVTLGVLITFCDLKNCKGNFLDDGDVATDVLKLFGLPVKDIAVRWFTVFKNSSFDKLVFSLMAAKPFLIHQPIRNKENNNITYKNNIKIFFLISVCPLQMNTLLTSTFLLSTDGPSSLKTKHFMYESTTFVSF